MACAEQREKGKVDEKVFGESSAWTGRTDG